MALECSDILKQGIFNVVHFEDYESMENHYYEWLMNVNESEARSATNLGLDMTIDVEGVPIPLKTNFTQDDWSTWSKKREHLKKSDITKISLVKSFSRTVDQGLVKAWSECMSKSFSQIGKQQGLVLDVSKQSFNVVPVEVTLVFEGEPVHAAIHSWVVTNAKVIAGKVPKRLVSNTPVLVTYQRLDPNSEVTISIDTARGTIFEVIRPEKAPAVPIKLHRGQDYGAADTPELELTVSMTQDVRVWGGVIAQYEQPGNPSASAWLFRDKLGGHQEWKSPPDVQMQLHPDGSQPYVSLFGMPFRGTVVGQFDYLIRLEAGESLRLVGHTANHHAKAANFLLFVDYVEMPDPDKVATFRETLKAI